jgi:hypothetical protein
MRGVRSAVQPLLGYLQDGLPEQPQHNLCARSLFPLGFQHASGDRTQLGDGVPGRHTRFRDQHTQRPHVHGVRRSRMTLLHLRWYLGRSRMMNQHAAVRIFPLLNLHRRPAEPSARLVIDVCIPSGVVREHVPYGYVEMSETVSVHECYVLNAVEEGNEVRPEGVWLIWGNELRRPLFHDNKGKLISVHSVREGVWGV